MADNAWFSLNLSTKVQHLRTHYWDHKALLIKLEGIVPCPDHPFKFEQIWLREDGCRVTVNNVWGPTSRSATMVQIATKIRVCREKILDWSHQSFGSIKKQLETKGKLLSKAEVNASNGITDYEVVKVLWGELNDLLDKESLMWQQRSRALFLKCGDRNTTFFHSKASHRS